MGPWYNQAITVYLGRRLRHKLYLVPGVFDADLRMLAYYCILLVSACCQVRNQPPLLQHWTFCGRSIGPYVCSRCGANRGGPIKQKGDRSLPECVYSPRTQQVNVAITVCEIILAGYVGRVYRIRISSVIGSNPWISRHRIIYSIAYGRKSSTTQTPPGILWMFY